MVIFEDFGGTVETCRLLTYFLPSLELVLRVFCLLEISFMLGAFEKILELEYSKPCEVGVSGCVGGECWMIRASRQAL